MEKQKFSQKDLDKLDDLIAFYTVIDPSMVPRFKEARERVYMELHMKD